MTYSGLEEPFDLDPGGGGEILAVELTADGTVFLQDVELGGVDGFLDDVLEGQAIVGEDLLQAAIGLANGAGHGAFAHVAGNVERVADPDGFAVAELVLARPALEFVGLERRQRVDGLQTPEQKQDEAKGEFHFRQAKS